MEDFAGGVCPDVLAASALLVVARLPALRINRDLIRVFAGNQNFLHEPFIW
jgi:hypothetical protein